MSALNLLSGGAAQGLVNALREEFQASSGFAVQGGFGAVGSMKDKLLAGAPCDVLILTHALIEQLTASGQVAPGSARPLGVVKTGVAVKLAEPAPDVSTAQALKAALLAATAMREMSQSSETGLIGCTQVSEILYTANVRLVANLPKAFELATVYTAAVCAKSSNAIVALEFVELLSGASCASQRAAVGFEAGFE